MKIRPKVRYVARPRFGSINPWMPWDVASTADSVSGVPCCCEYRASAKRIAAALNLAEAVRRGEVKVSK